MAYSRRADFHALRYLGNASILVTYVAVGSAFDDSVRIFQVQNFTDAQMLFSIDGSTDHFTLNPGGQVVYDVTANRVDEVPFFMEKGDTVYVRHTGVAPTSGSVFVTAIHGETN